MEALPRRAREEVVRFSGALSALPPVSTRFLAALQELRLTIRRTKASTVEDAVRQAHARRRAWELGTLKFSGSRVTNLSALAGCTTLHTLGLSGTGVADVSALAGCPALHTLTFGRIFGVNARVTDVSALAGCAALHTLDLSWCRQLMDVSALASCASLRTLDLSYCGQVSDVSGWLREAPHAQLVRLQSTDRRLAAGWLRDAARANPVGCPGVRDVSALRPRGSKSVMAW